MNVLDPFEVLSIELYPMWELADVAYSDVARQLALNNAEFSVYHKVLELSTYHAVLNEADMLSSEIVTLPTPYRGRIVPEGVYQLRKHPDIRIARRAMTVANLARVISERDVSTGLRRTLHTQARRLEYLARKRLEEFGGEFPIEAIDAETGDRAEIDDELSGENSPD